jgi:hypothetical protein
MNNILPLKKFKGKALVYNELQALSVVIQNGTKRMINDELIRLHALPLLQSDAWQKCLISIRCALDGAPRHTIIMPDGNSKLPFYAFSTLPGVSCPGAGNCLSFCYSFSSWRHPTAFAVQAGNALLMRFYTCAIEKAFHDIPDNVTFRLYVDGDFSSDQDIKLWFNLIGQRPTIKVYGYSKSLKLLADYTGIMPANYMLNLSSGHNADKDTVKAVKQLPIYRGEFIAVDIGRKVRSVDHGTSDTNTTLRQTYKSKAFPCPGKCGTCTPAGHACGSDRFKGIDIIIAVH